MLYDTLKQTLAIILISLVFIILIPIITGSEIPFRTGADILRFFITLWFSIIISLIVSKKIGLTKENLKNNLQKISIRYQKRTFIKFISYNFLILIWSTATLIFSLLIYVGMILIYKFLVLY